MRSQRGSRTYGNIGQQVHHIQMFLAILSAKLSQKSQHNFGATKNSFSSLFSNELSSKTHSATQNNVNLVKILLLFEKNTARVLFFNCISKTVQEKSLIIFFLFSYNVAHVLHKISLCKKRISFLWRKTTRKRRGTLKKLLQLCESIISSNIFYKG